MAAVSNTSVLGVDITSNESTNKSGHKLGTRISVSDNGEAVYVQAGSAITQYHTVGIDENFAAYPLTKAMADDGWNIGFAQVALTKDNYGWVHTKGSDIKATGAAACAPDVALYTTATAGVLDDTSLNQTKLDGVVFAATASGTSAEIIATFPRSATF